MQILTIDELTTNGDYYDLYCALSVRSADPPQQLIKDQLKERREGKVEIGAVHMHILKNRYGEVLKERYGDKLMCAAHCRFLFIYGEKSMKIASYVERIDLYDTLNEFMRARDKQVKVSEDAGMVKYSGVYN